MTEYHSFGRRLWRGWHAASALLRGPSGAASMIATSISGALMLTPAGIAWPTLNLADALTSVDILDWVKVSLGLIFSLWRRIGNTNGD